MAEQGKYEHDWARPVEAAAEQGQYEQRRTGTLCVRRCLKQNLLSNPRRIHSEEEDEEKEE
jgi:hypothetical protein